MYTANDYNVKVQAYYKFFNMKKPRTTSDEVVTFRQPPAIDLRELARQHNVSRAKFVQDAITAYVNSLEEKMPICAQSW